MAADLQSRLFEAAFAAREAGAFEIACAREAAQSLGAAAAVVTWTSTGLGQSLSFASTPAALALTSQPADSDPLARCRKAGAVVQHIIDTAANPLTPHDIAARDLGWQRCLCLPLHSHTGALLAVIVAYFAGRVDLHKKAQLFTAHLHAPLAAAIAARRARSADAVETHQFSSLAAAIPGVVYQRVVRPDGDIRYTYLSEGARELFGVAPEDVLRDPEVLFRTYTEEYRQNFRTRLVEASASLTNWDVEASVIMPDGRRKTTHAIARPEPLADGSVLWTGVILDASRAKEAEDSLKEANRLVSLANQAKSAFLAKMSHEMRTPLNGVLGMGDLLLKTELTQRQMRLATTLCESAKGLLGIINDVLDLSRIEAGHFKLDLQDFNLRHCVEDAVELCATSGYRKGLEVNLITSIDTPIGVKSDPVRIRQVLINLIGNAIKFTEAGEITIRLSTEPEVSGKTSVVFEVSDTGIGIAPAAIQRLFEPFAQADATISRRFGGTGLGLSITRHLVELLGGTISLSSERGCGTTVRFVLPFDVTASAQTPSILGEMSLNGARILIVDDRATNREMLANNLAGSGARVECAMSETHALTMLTAATLGGDPYKITVLDRVRPRCSSLHLCRTIRANRRLAATSMVVLMSPNWNANPIDQKGLTDTQFLSKPARRADLLAAIARTLDPNTVLTNRTDAAGFPTPASRTAAPALHLRVLLVEDNATNIEVAREYLMELECRVTVAVNGIEAIAEYDRSTFDIILMDSQMPELDGLSATRRIRECERTRNLKPVPIIAVTANAYDSDRLQAINAGSNDFLSKPFSDLQLRAMLQKWSPEAPHRGNGQPPMSPPLTDLVSVAQTERTPVDEHLDEALHTVLMKSRPAFLERLLRAFLSSVPESLTTLRAAVAHDDTELLRMCAHSLKSASANVGAKRLAELCKVLEVKLRLGASSADCRLLSTSVETELAYVEKALEQRLTQLSTAGQATRTA